MVRTVFEPLPALQQSFGETGRTRDASSQPSRIPVKSGSSSQFGLGSKSTPSPTSRAPPERKRPVLGERDDNLDDSQTSQSTIPRKSRHSKLVINPLRSQAPSVPTQSSASRASASPWSVRTPSSMSLSSAAPSRIPRPSFTRLEAGLDEDMTQLLDMRAPMSPSGLTTDSEDDWGSGMEEVGNVTAGRTPMPPRRSLGVPTQTARWGQAVEGGGRLMTPMASQELSVSHSPSLPAPVKIHSISRLPTPPSSQPAEPASTPQRPSPPIRRRPRPSPTPPRRLPTETVAANQVAEPSPNPRTKKNPRLSSLGSVADLRPKSTPKSRLEVVLPIRTSTSSSGSKLRTPAGSQRGSHPPVHSASGGASSSQPMTGGRKRSTPPAAPSTAPAGPRKSTGSSRVTPPTKPRKSRTGSRKSTPTAAVRRRSMTPAALRKAVGRDVVIGSGVPDVESSPGDDPLLLKSESDDETVSQPLPLSQSSGRKKGKGRASSLGLDLGTKTESSVPATAARRTVMQFPFRPYTTAPPPPRLVPEWVPRTMRKKKIELGYETGASGPLDETGQADGFDSDYDSDEGGFGAREDDTFMNVLSRRGVAAPLGAGGFQAGRFGGVEEGKNQDEGEEDGCEVAQTSPSTPHHHRFRPQQPSSVSPTRFDRSGVAATPARLERSYASPVEQDPGFNVEPVHAARPIDSRVENAIAVPQSSPTPSDTPRYHRETSAVPASQVDLSLEEKRIVLQDIFEYDVSTYTSITVMESSASPLGAQTKLSDVTTNSEAAVDRVDTPLSEEEQVEDEEITDADIIIEADISADTIATVADELACNADITVGANTTAELDTAEWDESLALAETESVHEDGPVDAPNALTMPQVDTTADFDVTAWKESITCSTTLDAEAAIEVPFTHEDGGEHVEAVVVQTQEIESRHETVLDEPGMNSAVARAELEQRGEPQSSATPLTINDWSAASQTSHNSTAAEHTTTTSFPSIPLVLDDTEVLYTPEGALLVSSQDQHHTGISGEPKSAEKSPSRPAQTFEEIARSSLSSSHISESEGDVTLDAIEGGWDSDESSGDLAGDVSVPERAAERSTAEGTEDTIFEAETSERTEDVTELEPESQLASNEQDGPVESAHGQSLPILYDALSDASGVTQSGAGVQLGMADAADAPYASPAADSEDSGAADQAGSARDQADQPDLSSPSGSTSAAGPALTQEADVDNGKIVLKLINRGVVKVEPAVEEEVEESDAEFAEGSEAGSDAANAYEDSGSREIRVDVSQTTTEPEEEIEYDNIDGSDSDEQGEDEDGSGDEWREDGPETRSKARPDVDAALALVAYPAEVSSFDHADTAGPVDPGLRTPPTRTIALSTTPLCSPPAHMRSLLSDDRAIATSSRAILLEFGHTAVGETANTTPAPRTPPRGATHATTPPAQPLAHAHIPSRLREEVPSDTASPSAGDVEPSTSHTILHASSAVRHSDAEYGWGEMSVLSEGPSIRVANKSLLAELVRVGGKEKERELRNVVEVSSLDPRAAARAAAILKLNHNYIEHGILPSDAPLTPTLAPAKERSRRKSYTSHHFASAASARKLTREELLNEAELEIVVNEASPGRQRREGTAFSSISGVSGMTDLPVPGGWIRTPKRKRSRPADIAEDEAAATPIDAVTSKWGVSEWKRLEKVHRAEKQAWMREREVKPGPGGLMSWARRSTGIGMPRVEVRPWDDMRVVRQFLKAEGLVESAGEWSENVVLLRVQALERRVSAKLINQQEDPSEPTSKKAKVVPLPTTPQRLQFGSHTTPSALAPPSTIKRLVNWVWGAPQMAGALPGRSKGKQRDARERPIGAQPLLPVARVSGDPQPMSQVAMKTASLPIPPPPPRASLPRMSGRDLLDQPAPVIDRPATTTTHRPPTAPVSVVVPTSTFNPSLPSLGLSTASSASFLGLSTSSTATTATFPPQTPRIYPQLNQSISQRSAAIKALFPAIHPLGDSTSSTSSSTSTAANTSGNHSRPISFSGLTRKTSVKDMAKSFEEKGTLDQALKRVPSGASELEALRRVQSHDRQRR